MVSGDVTALLVTMKTVLNGPEAFGVKRRVKVLSPAGAMASLGVSNVKRGSPDVNDEIRNVSLPVFVMVSVVSL